MKKLIFITAALLLPILVSAQSNEFYDFYDKYAGKDGYTTVEMSSAMFKAMGRSSKKDQQALNGLKNMVIVISECPSDEFNTDVRRLVRSNCYTPFTVVRDGKDTVEMHIGEENNKIRELLIVIKDSSDTIVMSFGGDDLNIKSISQIAQQAAGIEEIYLDLDD